MIWKGKQPLGSSHRIIGAESQTEHCLCQLVYLRSFFFVKFCIYFFVSAKMDLDLISFLVDLCCANDHKQQERSPSVIVIGGGMAGIAAARALHDASFQVSRQIKSLAIFHRKF